MFKTSTGRESHPVKFIKSDENGQSDDRAEERRSGIPHQQQEERKEMLTNSRMAKLKEIL